MTRSFTADCKPGADPPPSAYVVRVLLQAGGDAQLLLSGPRERGGRGANKSQ